MVGSTEETIYREVMPGAKWKVGYEVLHFFCFVLPLFIWKERWGVLLRVQLSGDDFLFTSCRFRKLDAGHQTRC